jgi:hypothetical protein
LQSPLIFAKNSFAVSFLLYWLLLIILKIILKLKLFLGSFLSKYYFRLTKVTVLLPLLSSRWDKTNFRTDMTFEQVRFPDVSTRDREYVKANCLTTYSMASCGFIGLNMLNITGSQSGCFVWLKKVLQNE